MAIKELLELHESAIQIEMLMTLEQIIRDGKITNGAQVSVLATLLQLLRQGKLTKTADYNAVAVTKQMTDAIKASSDEVIVQITQQIIDVLKADNPVTYNQQFHQTMNMGIGDWMRNVIKAQR